MRKMSEYIDQLKDWPKFHWKDERITTHLCAKSPQIIVQTKKTQTTKKPPLKVVFCAQNRNRMLMRQCLSAC